MFFHGILLKNVKNIVIVYFLKFYYILLICGGFIDHTGCQ